jgi:cytochrome c biogenesis protein CcdA
VEVPFTLALAAGALATLNPCGFPLLPAFLSFYVGAQEERLPRAAGVLQGLVVGLVVTAGFLAVFVVVGLPVAYGAGAVSDALPWVGVVLGGLLVALGLAALAGRTPRVPLRWGMRARPTRGAGPMLLFGVGYGVASLGCTLPVFLAVVGAAASGASTVLVFAVYGAGMAVVLTALSVAAALLRDGLARGLRRLLPHMSRIAGALLVAAGGYLAYYWYRVGFGPATTLSEDPIVVFVTRFTSRVQTAAEDGGALVVVAASVVVALGVAAILRRRVTWRP